MWLIPTAGAGAVDKPEPETGHNVRFNYNLQYIQEERSDSLDKRKRQLLGALAIAGGVGVAGSGWFLALKREDESRPSFVLMAPEVAQATPSPVDTTRHPDDTLRVGLNPPPPPRVVAVDPPPDPGEAPVRGLSRRDSIRLGLITRPRDTTRTAPPPVVAVRDTAVAPVQPPPPPPPPPPPTPPPAPSGAARHRPAPPRVDMRLRAAAIADLNRESAFSRAAAAREASVVSGMFAPSEAQVARSRTVPAGVESGLDLPGNRTGRVDRDSSGRRVYVVDQVERRFRRREAQGCPVPGFDEAP
jgi:hypothetical protein